MNGNWHYSIKLGDGGLNKKPARYKDLGEHSIKIFVREVIQNNLDAALNGGPIHVKFTIKEWDEQDITNFKNFLGKDHLELLKKSVADPDPSVKPYLRDSGEIINNKKKSSFLIIVEESNCIGLTGPVRESKLEKSHFDALMRKIENNEAKKETSNSGGTWGKGSSIFTYTSGLWTWFSYSYLSKPWKDTRLNVEHYTRLIGRCMIPPFFDEDSNQSYLGDAWYCDVEKFKKNKLEDCYPFINEIADNIANQLGIEKRKKPGTTFFVPFFNPIIETGNEKINQTSVKNEFLFQILFNWFIPIYNQELIIELVSGEEIVTINKEYLYSIPELKFKLELLDWYNNKCPHDPRFLCKQIKIDVPALKPDYLNDNNLFAKTKQTVSCDLLIRILEEDEDFDNNWKTLNKVALSRNKGMIVDHEEIIESQTFRAESILLGGLLSNSEKNLRKRQHLDLFLGYSENAAHSIWCRRFSDYDRCFLDYFEFKGRKPHSVVNQLFQDITKILNQLAKDEAEIKDNKEINTIFKKLAKLGIGGSDSISLPPFKIRKLEDKIDQEGRFIFKRRIISNLKDKTTEIIFITYVNTLEGEKKNVFEQLEITEFSNLEILDENQNLITSGNNPKIELPPDSELIINIRTCPIIGNARYNNVDPFIKITANTPNNE